MTSRFLSTLAALALFFAGVAHAQVPRTINYQGYLTSPSGAAISANLPLVFKIYNVLSGGPALHTEPQTIAVTNGVFNVLLGSAVSLTLPFDTQYYLGVTVGTDSELAPRQALASSPYALRAASAEALAASAIVPGSQIAAASVTASRLASNGCAGGQVLQYNGSVWVCATPAASSGGTVTSITAGTGLTGGPITSSGTIAADTTFLQRRVASSCPAGSSIRAIAGDGTVTCQIDAVGSGTVTSIATGAGLSGGPITSSGTVNLASTQLLPTLACAVDQTVRWTGSAWACATNGTAAANTAAPQNTSVTAIDPGGDVGQYSAITVAPDGLPVISYYDVTNGDLKVAKCGNAACTLGNTVTAVDTAGNVGQFTSITIGSDGLPVISYYDVTNGDLKVAKCGNAACRSGNTLAVLDTAGDVGAYTSIAIGADGMPVISYQDRTSNSLKVAKCGNGDCTAGNIINAVATGGGFYTSIAMPPDGFPFISFSRGSFPDNNNAHILKCNDAACSPGLLQPPMAIDTPTSSANFSSVAIGPDGYPVVSSVVRTSGELRVSHCNRQSCNSFQNTSVSQVFGGGKFTSMAIGAQGTPIISYVDFANRVVRVAKCANAVCSGENAFHVIGPTGDITSGHATSIAIGADGMPIMSYYDNLPFVTRGLRVAKCSNAFCAPFFRSR